MRKHYSLTQYHIYKYLNPAVKLEGHSSVGLNIEVEPVLLRIGVQTGEVVGLLLRQVEVRVGERCRCTLAL